MYRMTAQPHQESVWDYPRPPRLEAENRRLSVRVGFVVVAETTNGLRLLETSHPPVYYFPRSDVATEFIHPNPRKTVCEWKGTATYWDIVVGSSILPGAAWSYENPLDPYRAMRGHLAFYPGRALCMIDEEAVSAQEGGFYGGWITHETTGPFKGATGSSGW
ncbi:DUF427 domain-containing protein [Streptomyces zaomyceticus]|uniref:DUF427 domain-containing protein n=1 Tax=Streptomyces zaomyceticus TaxID=68286 RepID=UPI0035D9EE45